MGLKETGNIETGPKTINILEVRTSGEKMTYKLNRPFSQDLHKPTQAIKV
jgi:hypothetical protein